MVDEETLNFRIPVRIGIGPLKIMPYCCIGPASKPSKFEERVRFSHKARKIYPCCGVNWLARRNVDPKVRNRSPAAGLM